MRRDTINFKGEQISGTWVSEIAAARVVGCSAHSLKCNDSFSTPKHEKYRMISFFGSDPRYIIYQDGRTEIIDYDD